MAQVKTTLVAGGVMGVMETEWHILKQYDMKYNSVCYDLRIANDLVDTYPTLIEAMEALIDIFKD